MRIPGTMPPLPALGLKVEGVQPGVSLCGVGVSHRVQWASKKAE